MTSTSLRSVNLHSGMFAIPGLLAAVLLVLNIDLTIKYFKQEITASLFTQPGSNVFFVKQDELISALVDVELFRSNFLVYHGSATLLE